MLRPFGIRVPSRQEAKPFDEAARYAVQHDAVLYASIVALLEALAAIDSQLAQLDDLVKKLARRSPGG